MKRNRPTLSANASTQNSVRTRPRTTLLISAIGIAVGVTLVSGLLHGRMSQRWGMDTQMQVAATQLQLFPERIGVWQQEATYELGKSAMELLECQGYIHRGYRNQETGDYIKLSVMVGPGSKMSIHVPEICYEASNFSLLGSRQNFSVDAQQKHEFWTVQFQINDVSERNVRVIYGWSTDGQWMAPRMPRWSVAGYPVLYKLQLSHVISDVTTADSSDTDESLQGFMQDTLTVLQQLIGATADSSRTSSLLQDDSPEPTT